MIICVECQEIVVDFVGYQLGDMVILYFDDSLLVEFWIYEFMLVGEELFIILIKIDYLILDLSLFVKQVVMFGMDEMVMIDGKKFQMDWIDYMMLMGKCQFWDIININDMNGGMIYFFYMYGCVFEIVFCNGQEFYLFEYGFNDIVVVNLGEYVIIKVYF